MFSYTGPAVPIPDADEDGASVEIPVAGFGYASKVALSVDGTTCNTTAGSTTVGIDHTFVGDLVGTLTAPGGSIATVFDGGGGGGNNICQAVFTDTATRDFGDALTSAAPFTGDWLPATPLAELLGAPADGTWTLNVADTAAVDTGNVRAVSLRLTGFADD